jgi:hypothetical protein
VALTEKEVSAVMVAPNLVTAVMLRGAGRKQEGRGVAVARDVPEKNKRREKKEKRWRQGSTPFKWERWGGGWLAEGTTRRQGVGGGRGVGHGGRVVWGGRHRPRAGGRGRVVHPGAKQGRQGGCQVGPGHSSGWQHLSLI